MKKMLLVVAALCMLTGCQEAKNDVEHTVYIESGRYYTSGIVVTQKGNEWLYSQDIISEMESYDNEPVLAMIDDNGTPEIIQDDVMLGLVLDVETAIYDDLEASLSENFIVERNGNEMRVLPME